MLNLLIDTCTERAFFALVRDDNILHEEHFPKGYHSSSLLLPKMEEVFNTLHIKPSDIDLITVGIGPGSYTGMRVGAVVAKVLTFAHKTPMVGISTLMAFIPNAEGLFASIIDARIGGAYLLLGKREEKGIRYLSQPQVYTLEEAIGLIKDVKYLVTPNATSLKGKVESLVPHSRWEWIETTTDTIHLHNLALEKHQKGESTSDGSLELLYLRQDR